MLGRCLLTAQADQGDVELLWKLLENEPGTEITVDLQSRTIVAKDVVARFQVDDYTRWRLLEGLDDISLTLRHEAAITDFEGHRPAFPADNSRASRVRSNPAYPASGFVLEGDDSPAVHTGNRPPSPRRTWEHPPAGSRCDTWQSFARWCWTHVL